MKLYDFGVLWFVLGLLSGVILHQKGKIEQEDCQQEAARADYRCPADDDEELFDVG